MYPRLGSSMASRSGGCGPVGQATETIMEKKKKKSRRHHHTHHLKTVNNNNNVPDARSPLRTTVTTAGIAMTGIDKRTARVPCACTTATPRAAHLSAEQRRQARAGGWTRHRGTGGGGAFSRSALVRADTHNGVRSPIGARIKLGRF